MCQEADYTHDIVKGLFSGLFGGIGVFIIKLIWDAYLMKRDESRIVEFFKEAETNKVTWEFRNTYAIASETNLTEDRVRYVCSTSNKIRRNKKEKEVWEKI